MTSRFPILLALLLALLLAACNSPSESYCTAKLDDVSSAINKIAPVYAACTVDSDCVVEFPDTKCASSCGVAVAKSSKTAFDAVKTALGEQMCDSIWADCGQIYMMSCIPITAVCTNGKCTAVRCSEISKQFQTKVNEILYRRATCTADQDCDFVTFDHGCISVATTAVNAVEKQAFIDEVSALEGEYCSNGCSTVMGYKQAANDPLKCIGDFCQWNNGPYD